MPVSVSPFVDGQCHTEKSIRDKVRTLLKHHCLEGTQSEEYMASRPASIGKRPPPANERPASERPASERPASERPPVPEKAKGSEWEVDVRELAKRLKDGLRDAKEGELPTHLRSKIYRAKQIIAKARDARRKQL